MHYSDYLTGVDWRNDDTIKLTQNWRCKPEFTTATTASSISNVYSSTTTDTGISAHIADEINRRVNEIYKERETRMTRVKFNDLAKDLKELGVELETIRHDAGNKGCEIEGYFYPERYTIHRAKEMCSVPITPKRPIPKKVIFDKPATIVYWVDGSKTVVICQEGDIYDEEKGLAMAISKKALGNNWAAGGRFKKAFKNAIRRK